MWKMGTSDGNSVQRHRNAGWDHARHTTAQLPRAALHRAVSESSSAKQSRRAPNVLHRTS